MSLNICVCIRCGHEWNARKADRPARCAKCGRPFWWRAKREPQLKPLQKNTLRGRSFKYPVNVLLVGQEMTLPWPDNILSMKQSIDGYSRRSGRVFTTKSTTAGLVVFRVS